VWSHHYSTTVACSRYYASPFISILVETQKSFMVAEFEELELS